MTQRRLALPLARPAPPRPPFPIAVAVLPVVGAVVLWALTQSPAMLGFAALGPLGAVAARWDARRERRRAIRAERARLAEALDELAERVGSAQEEARAEPPPDEAALVPLGRGTVPSGIVVEGELEEADAELRLRGRGLAEAARELADGPAVGDARAGIRLTAPPAVGRAIARSAVLHWATRLAPERARLRVPPGEEWARALPHPVEERAEPAVAAEVDGAELRLEWAEGAEVAVPGVRDLRPRLVSAAVARAVVRRLPAARAEPPPRVAWAELADGTIGDARAALAAPVGADAAGPVVVDLVASGPHAVVAGVTGSGKSELLASWVLALAARHPPAELSFLLVDYKGGAAFAPLEGLPQVVGVMTDLDAALARRAIDSLRAELGRRERVLAGHAARGIGDLPRGALARLVIVVDEAAALLAGDAELHALFADLAARGRSLGLHLVLATQRPSGVLRDGLLANAPLRISLRVIDRGDSTALLGDDSAARLPVDPRGRAILADGTGLRQLQVPVASAADIAAVAERWAGAPRAVRPWLDPLPRELPRARLPAAPGIVFGREDRPAEQAQPAAAWDPHAGALLVLGTRGSGTSTALAVLAEAAPGLRVLPEDPADAWQVLSSPPEGGLLADALDALLERCEPDLQRELVELAARAGRSGTPLAAGGERWAGPLASLGGAFPQRLLLRQAGRDDHVLAGGGGADFDGSAPPGRGRWRGVLVQVAVSAGEAGEVLAARRIAVPVPPVGFGGEVAVVTGRPAELAGRLRALGIPAEELDRDEGLAAGRRVLVGDPDAWQAHWAALAAVRRAGTIVADRVMAAELRVLLRPRGAIPPLGPADCWELRGGELRRARLPD